MNRLQEISPSAGLAVRCLALLLAAAALMLACGPAAPPAPADGTDALPAATPTPVPTVCLQGTDRDGTWFEHCITPMPPKTPKYPNISSGGLLEQIEKFEEARDAAGGASGQSGSAADDPVVGVEIFLSTRDTGNVAAWLRSKGVLPHDLEKEAATYFVEDAGYLSGAIPVSLLGELSRQKGVVEVREPYMPVPTIAPGQ